MGAESSATARGSWNCHPFLMHNFSLGDPTSLSHCCRPQFFVRIDDEYSLIHPSNIEPAAPLSQALFSGPGPQQWARQTTFLISWSQHSSGKRQARARGSPAWPFIESWGKLWKYMDSHVWGPGPTNRNKFSGSQAWASVFLTAHWVILMWSQSGG